MERQRNEVVTSARDLDEDRTSDAPLSEVSPIDEAPHSTTGSIPPPPPSMRPEGERPKTTPSSLPPPVSMRPPPPNRSLQNRALAERSPAERSLPPRLPTRADPNRAVPSVLPSVPRVAPAVVTRTSDDRARLEEEAASLRKRLSAQHAETRVEQKNNELLRTELASVKNRLAELEKQGTDLQGDAAKSGQWALLQKAHHKHAEDLARLRTDHRTELDKVRQNHAQELANLKKSLFSPATNASGDDSAKLQELEAKYEARLDALRQRLRDAELKGGVTRIAELEQELADAQRTIVDLEAAASSSRAPTGPDGSSTNHSHGDDLTRLKGVGPAIAKSLKKEGITSFAQIAAWSPDDVEAIAPKIRTTAARIKKNRWIEAARELT